MDDTHYYYLSVHKTANANKNYSFIFGGQGTSLEGSFRALLNNIEIHQDKLADNVPELKELIPTIRESINSGFLEEAELACLTHEEERMTKFRSETANSNIESLLASLRSTEPGDPEKH